MDKMGYLGNKGMINFRTQNSRAKRVKANSFDINEYQVPIFQKCIDKNIFFIRNIFFLSKKSFYFLFFRNVSNNTREDSHMDITRWSIPKSG